MQQEPEVAVKDVWGVCFYCHLRQGWKVAIERSPIWPHTLVCPRCGSRWRNAAEFNADAKSTVMQVLRESPDKIDEMNKTDEDREWATTMDDAIGERKDRQNFESLKRTGKPWEPYYNDECKPRYIRTVGVPYKESDDGEAGEAADDNEPAQGAGAEAGCDTDTGEAAGDRGDGTGSDDRGRADSGDGVRE